MGRLRRLMGLLAIAALLAACAWPARTRGLAYRAVRAGARLWVVHTLPGYQRLEGPHFTVYYPPGADSAARMVLEAAEASYGPVVAALGYRPPGKAPVVVHPDRRSLAAAFGWAQGEAATGVYWAGVIRVLSPDAWIHGRSEAQRRELFRRLHPLAHEFTHYVLDYRTDGNYPRWFTEGLAQWMEYRVTGYRWLVPAASLRQPLYSLADLEERFDQLPNQALAYRQSYLLVDHLVHRCGAGGMDRLLDHLAGGRPFAKALAAACGMDLDSFARDWERWVQDHLDQLEEEIPNW